MFLWAIFNSKCTKTTLSANLSMETSIISSTEEPFSSEKSATIPTCFQKYRIRNYHHMANIWLKAVEKWSYLISYWKSFWRRDTKYLFSVSLCKCSKSSKTIWLIEMKSIVILVERVAWNREKIHWINLTHLRKKIFFWFRQELEGLGLI